MTLRFRGLTVVASAALLCACGGASGSGGRVVRAAVRIEGGAASCADLSGRQQLAAARIVVDGVFDRGPTVAIARAPVLASPARLRVTRYLKGHGPRTLRVQTAFTRTRSGLVGNSEGIEPRAGQRWRIYSDRSRQPLATSICAGSRRLRRRAASS